MIPNQIKNSLYWEFGLKPAPWRPLAWPSSPGFAAPAAPSGHTVADPPPDPSLSQTSAAARHPPALQPAPPLAALAAVLQTSATAAQAGGEGRGGAVLLCVNAYC